MQCASVCQCIPLQLYHLSSDFRNNVFLLSVTRTFNLYVEMHAGRNVHYEYGMKSRSGTVMQ
jgi:hypothetical protein